MKQVLVTSIYRLTTKCSTQDYLIWDKGILYAPKDDDYVTKDKDSNGIGLFIQSLYKLFYHFMSVF